MKVRFENIPLYNEDTDEWSEFSFDTQKDFKDFLISIFKEPGLYEFDESTDKWNSEANKFDKDGLYCRSPYNSIDYRKYWDDQKKKCRTGIIWKNGPKSWYIDGAYYMLLNFLPIMNKEMGNIESFPSIRDVQYHIALYEKIAETDHKHSIVTKKRQCLSSYWHTAKMICVFFFEKKAILRNLASDEAYLTGDKGIWNYYNGYRDFLNEHTAWYRPNSPNKDLSWIQRIEVNNAGLKSFRGLKSIMTGVTLKKSPTAGVGGPSYYSYHEEAGVAPKMDKTYIFTKPALSSMLGQTTGMFIAAGSVGELKDCKPLKKYMYAPEENGFLGTTNNFCNKDKVPKITGLYIPEQWGMPGFVDEHGNSLVDEALAYIDEVYTKMEKEMTPEDFQLELSQRPRYLDEAFANREVSKFPIRQLEKRQSALKDQDRKPKKAELYEEEGVVKIRFIEREDAPYPVDPKSKDKRGCVLIHKMPEQNPKMFTYYAGVDNVEVGTSETSPSLYSIYVVEGSTEVVYWDESNTERIKIEGDKIVASWTGRYDDIDDTNEQGELLIRLYNAFTLCERNKPNFITHMIKKGYRHLLASSNDVPLFKEAQDIIDPSSKLDIGIYMDNTNKKQGIADDYLIKWLKQPMEVFQRRDKDGNLTEEVTYVQNMINFLDDYWLMEELRNEKDNTDRRDALRLAIMLKTMQQAIGRKSVRVDRSNQPSEVQTKKLIKSINFLGNNNQVDYSTKRKINYIG